MNWTATILIALGIILIVVGWYGTHNDVLNVLKGNSSGNQSKSN